MPLRITSKEGQSRELPVSALSRPDPRAARQIPKDRPLLVAAPYLSRAVREAIEDARRQLGRVMGVAHRGLDVGVAELAR